MKKFLLLVITLLCLVCSTYGLQLGISVEPIGPKLSYTFEDANLHLSVGPTSLFSLGVDWEFSRIDLAPENFFNFGFQFGAGTTLFIIPIDFLWLVQTIYPIAGIHMDWNFKKMTLEFFLQWEPCMFIDWFNLEDATLSDFFAPELLAWNQIGFRFRF